MSRWPQTEVERFESKVDRSGGADACHLWMASVAEKGYGKFFVHGRLMPAHRYAWERLHGPAGAGMFVCHRCDNPRCVNLSHLFLGTNADNVRDMYAKGRGTWRGRACAVITDSLRDDMRMLRSAGVTLRDIAGVFGVSYGATRTALLKDGV